MKNYIEKYRKTGDKKYLRFYYSSGDYLKTYSKLTPKWAKKFQIMIDLMDLKNGEKILDVGCAAQMFKPYVERKGAMYRGLDISECFNPDYICDAEDMNVIKDDEFDWVVLSDVLEHLPNPIKAIQEAHRVSKKVIAVIPNWYQLDRLSFLPRHPNDRHLTRMHPKKWIQQFEKAGFKITRIQGFFYVPSVAFYPISFLQSLDRFFRNPFFLRCSSIIDDNSAGVPLVRFCGQELIIIGTK